MIVDFMNSLPSPFQKANSAPTPAPAPPPFNPLAMFFPGLPDSVYRAMGRGNTSRPQK